MDPITIAAIIGAIGTIAGAIIGLQSGKKRGREEKEREIDDAPRKFVDHLDRIIKNAVLEGSEKAVINARAIVSTRNDLRDSMIKISEQLNSEIDRLGEEVGELSRDRGFSSVERRRLGSQDVYETIQVLAIKWPAKKDQVEIELRKLLAELGILGKSPSQSRDQWFDEHMPPGASAAPPSSE